MQKDLLVDRKVLLGISIISLTVIVFGMISRNTVLPVWFDFVFDAAHIVTIAVWIVVFVDILRNPLHNKTMWIVGMLVTGMLTGILYLINREKHLRLAQKFPNSRF